MGLWKTAKGLEFKISCLIRPGAKLDSRPGSEVSSERNWSVGKKVYCASTPQSKYPNPEKVTGTNHSIHNLTLELVGKNAYKYHVEYECSTLDKDGKRHESLKQKDGQYCVGGDQPSWKGRIVNLKIKVKPLTFWERLWSKLFCVN